MSEKSSTFSLKQRDLIIGGIFLCLAIIFYFFTFQLSGYELESVPFDMGPKFMPRLLLGALAIEAVFLMALSMAKKEKRTTTATSLKPIFQKRPFIMLGVFLLYIYLTTLVGYIPSSIVFMIVGFLLLGVRNLWALTLIPPAVTIATFFLFGTLLNIYLPSGSLF